MKDSSFIDEYVKEHKEDLEALRKEAKSAGFSGQCYIIGDPDYPQKRLQYATTSFPERFLSPGIILYPDKEDGVGDIKKAIALCKRLKMAIAVRTGGHQYCGYSSTPPKNMQIDLSETFDSYEYDADANVLRCGVSHALGDWAQLNNYHGIYLPMGVCANVHLGGHVHTGGWGMVARSHGILADRVKAFDIILASGEQERIVRPNAQTTEHNNDVYYAVLGGGRGGDFGIVTHWEFEPLRDEDHPNSACYRFVWIWSEEKMENVVRQMQELSKLCADGTIPSDYEFMLTVTGLGKMEMLPISVKDDLKRLGITNIKAIAKLLEEVKDALKERGILGEGIWVPPMINMWMCFTNKGGAQEQFNDRWFESFASEHVCGKPLPLISKRMVKTPVSEGLAHYWIMENDREMEYPFVKSSRATMDIPDEFPKVYAQRMSEIMGTIGTRDGQHLVSQQQIYAGGAVAKNGKAGISSYSWREQAMMMSHDSFYLESRFYPNARETAEQWQRDNHEAFIEQGAYADKDMRMFAYTFGEQALEDEWQYYYDSREKYDRLRKIKSQLDPDGVFLANQFSLKPSD